MIDVEKIAEIFAGRSYEIEKVYRLIIQPKSILREWETARHGFLFVIRGEARMSVGGTDYRMHPGVVFHAAAGLELSAKVLSQSEFEYFSLFYRLNDLNSVEDGYEINGHYTLEPGANPRVTELLTLLHRNVRIKDSIGKLRIKELFLSIMHQVLADYMHRENESSPGRKVIEKAVTYINEHYMDPLTLGELADLHAMNPQRFSYYFHKYTGFRPIDYVIHYRMERAKELLKAGNFLVRDVAASVGYANPLYFSRIFKKKFGVSPSEYIPE